MTDETLQKQVQVAAEQAVTRASIHGGFDLLPALAKEIRAAYLSGISQAASLLIRAEGEVDARQLERALVAAGKSYGLIFGAYRTFKVGEKYWMESVMDPAVKERIQITWVGPRSIKYVLLDSSGTGEMNLDEAQKVIP